MDLPKTGPSACPSVYSFRYGNVGIISLDANELSWEIQGLLDYSGGAQARAGSRTSCAWRRDAQRRLHRRVLPRVRVLHLQRPQLRRRRPVQARAAVRQVPGRPGGPGPQPRLRAHQPADLRRQDQQRPVQQAGGGRLPREPAEVEPAKDGTTYVVVGTAGTPRYGWTGVHETDRNFAAGQGSGTTVHADAKKQAGPWVNEQDFSMSVRDRRLVAGPVRRLRLHRARRHARPRAGSGPRWCCGSSTSRAASLTGWCSPGSPPPELQDRPAPCLSGLSLEPVVTQMGSAATAGIVSSARVAQRCWTSCAPGPTCTYCPESPPPPSSRDRHAPARRPDLRDPGNRRLHPPTSIAGLPAQPVSYATSSRSATPPAPAPAAPPRPAATSTTSPPSTRAAKPADATSTPPASHDQTLKACAVSPSGI